MTPEQQRIAIAEACGFEHKLTGSDPVEDGYCWHDPDGKWPAELPDYCNDLNAVHDAEMIWLRSISVVEKYRAELKKVLAEKHSIELDILACSAQRAEALLRTIGKWTP